MRVPISCDWVPQPQSTRPSEVLLRRSALLAGILLSLATRPVPGDLVISEFMAVNSTTLLDSFDETSDWIEIHHQGFETIDLDGYFLTDDSGDLRKWRLPPVSLDGGGYLLVFASGKDWSDPG